MPGKRYNRDRCRSGKHLWIPRNIRRGQCYWCAWAARQRNKESRNARRRAQSAATQAAKGGLKSKLNGSIRKAWQTRRELYGQTGYKSGVSHGWKGSRRPQGKCMKGHRLTQENAYVAPDGRVYCRACQRIARGRHIRRKARRREFARRIPGLMQRLRKAAIAAGVFAGESAGYVASPGAVEAYMRAKKRLDEAKREAGL